MTVLYSDLSTFENQKRKLYLYVIPIVLLSLLFGLYSWNEFNFLDRTIVASYLILFISSYFLILKRIFFRVVELTIFISVSIVHLLLTYWSLHVESVQSQHYSISDAAVWTPMIYIYIFITFYGIYGIVLSIVLWSMTTAIILSSLSIIQVDMIDSLINYQLAMFVYIVILFFARKGLDASVRTSMLEQMAFKDMLTGIENRRAVHQLFEKLNSESKTYSIIFFDIDYFKKVNDQYGHSVGDSVLIEISRIISCGLNKSDFFARWGGEEFIVITKKETIDKTLKLAEKLKLLISQHQFKVVGKLTASFGISESQPGQLAELVLEQADQALYSAKASGRNKIMIFGEQGENKKEIPS